VLEELQAPDLTAVLVEGVMDDRCVLLPPPLGPCPWPAPGWEQTTGGRVGGGLDHRKDNLDVSKGGGGALRDKALPGRLGGTVFKGEAESKGKETDVEKKAQCKTPRSAAGWGALVHQRGEAWEG